MSNFAPFGDGLAIAAAGVTALGAAAGGATDALIDNRGGVDCYIKFGQSADVATSVATGVRIPANSIAVYGMHGATHIAVAVAPPGVPSLTVHLGQGD